MSVHNIHSQTLYPEQNMNEPKVWRCWCGGVPTFFSNPPTAGQMVPLCANHAPIWEMTCTRQPQFGPDPERATIDRAAARGELPCEPQTQS